MKFRLNDKKSRLNNSGAHRIIASSPPFDRKREKLVMAAHVPGFSRIGAQRELKFALEKFWRGESDEAALQAVGSELRARHWALQRDAGLDFVTVGDFAWYDHVLSTLAHLGALPTRFGFDARTLSLRQYFTLARGNDTHHAMELTKWFDTNYHYLVPELTDDLRFEGGVDWLFHEVRQARALGHRVKACLVGPVTLLCLAKTKNGAAAKLDFLAALLPAYVRLLRLLKAEAVEWVQIDEPVLATDLEPEWLAAVDTAYRMLSAQGPKILLASYFGSSADQAARLKALPVAGLHLDLHRAPEQLSDFLDGFPAGKVLSAGVVDGRNVWCSDLDAVLQLLAPARQQLGDRLWVSASCSLLHVPVDVATENRLNPGVREWLAFGAQKLNELAVIERALRQGEAAVHEALERSRRVRKSRAESRVAHLALVAERLAGVTPQHARRASDFSGRRLAQREHLRLPLFPTTTIGSFPQTDRIRRARAALKRNGISHLDYLNAMREEVRSCIERQIDLGLDVLVHGEPERSDMVEYFGARLRGFAVSDDGWVQSYGSRCVKPPIIYGDVYRPEPMTVAWAEYAQSLTEKPVKGMLTGPVTMLQWSFARDDQPRARTALQIALALRDEVMDLEKAGIAAIQIDEPALREGLPLRRRDRDAYLAWAVQAFRIAAGGVQDRTQIHTHMCYSEFNDVLPAIAALDADVITVETSRSDMELLDAFANFAYPNEIGPGVYDIHSPRVPDRREMLRLLEKAAGVIPADRLWVNPDCGLKTRNWPEVESALANMVAAARLMRERHAEKAVA
jgi:5-methyltetrahydropteroyltriglutamate--homocysteine methyltransferase